MNSKPPAGEVNAPRKNRWLPQQRQRQGLLRTSTLALLAGTISMALAPWLITGTGHIAAFAGAIFCLIAIGLRYFVGVIRGSWVMVATASCTAVVIAAAASSAEPWSRSTLAGFICAVLIPHTLRLESNLIAMRIVILSALLLATETLMTPTPTMGIFILVEVFLLMARYCEQYASAFASLLRMAHVPSRVILGFQGGEVNEFDGTLTVRDRDAHAWVEYWDEKQGVWTYTDPTLLVGYTPNRESRHSIDATGRVAMLCEALSSVFEERLLLFENRVERLLVTLRRSLRAAKKAVTQKPG